MREHFQKNLNIGKEVICKSPEEVTKTLQNHQEKYAIITHGLDDYSIYAASSNKSNSAKPYAGMRNPYAMATLKHYDLILSIISDNDKIGGPVTEVDFAHFILRPEDYVFAAHQFNRLYEASVDKKPAREYYDAKKSLGLLHSKTLLIDKNNITFSPESAKGYDFPFKFFDYDEVKKAVLEKEEGKAFVLMLWSDQLNTFTWVVADTHSGEIYSQVSHGGVNFSKFGEFEPPAKLKKMMFKSFDSTFANKVNNRYK